MHNPLGDLLNLLHLQKIDAQNYIGNSEDLGLPQVYGGQVIGQALSAAKQTVCETRFVHSFHSYFLQAGDPNQPIHYDVENIRDGKSFSTRRVRAMQAQQPIFYLTASYQVVESGLNHQSSMPQTTGPEGLASESQLFQMMAKQVPPSVQKLLGGERAIEMRPITINNPLAPQKTEPKHAVWLRANGALPDDYRIHQYLLGYASDWNFLPTSLNPHGLSILTPGLKMATIDHAMWFHRPFKLDEWLLFVIDSPSAHNARGFVRGEFFNQSGELVASVAQEGLLRINPPKN